jgi:hypothetical protein
MLAIHESPEGAILSAARNYVESVLQAHVDIEGAADVAQLPSFLGQRYVLIAGRLLRRNCVFMIPHVDAAETPATIAKHRDLLKRYFPAALIVLTTDRLSNHNRHRLIAHHVPFIVPGNQLFIPELAADLREYFRSEPNPPAQTLSPTGQLLILAVLLKRIETDTPSGLAARFNYSAMTVGRALDELVALELVEVELAGKSRHVQFLLPRNDLWQRSRTYLRSPVRKRRRVRRPSNVSDLVLAGESALAEWTDLDHPSAETWAIAASDWKALAKQYDLERPIRWDEPVIELETWAYDPLLLADRKIVDPISLWLSIPDTADERLAMAKEKLLEQVGL